jgi:hypothetical protein
LAEGEGCAESEHCISLRGANADQAILTLWSRNASFGPELAQADGYKVAAYVRVKAPLASGLEAWSMWTRAAGLRRGDLREVASEYNPRVVVFSAISVAGSSISH